MVDSNQVFIGVDIGGTKIGVNGLDAGRKPLSPHWIEVPSNSHIGPRATVQQILVGAKTFLENFENEVERTRQACDRLMELELLQEMRFDATLPNGEKLAVDGFMAVDEKKLLELPDAQVVELVRNGLMSLIEMHRVSMSNMNRLAALSAAKA